jgi:hypothetical protein
LSRSRILLPTHTGTASTDTEKGKQKNVKHAVHGYTEAEKLVLIKMRLEHYLSKSEIK